MSFDSSAFIADQNGMACRWCDVGASPSPARAWNVYLGECTWPTTGQPRAVVVFVCVECGAIRYLDLATTPEAGDMPRQGEGG